VACACARYGAEPARLWQVTCHRPRTQRRYAIYDVRLVYMRGGSSVTGIHEAKRTSEMVMRSAAQCGWRSGEEKGRRHSAVEE